MKIYLEGNMILPIGNAGYIVDFPIDQRYKEKRYKHTGENKHDRG